MTLMNMCNNCPHTPFKHKVVGGAEVVPDWMQYISETFWNKPELTEPPQWLLEGLKKNTELTPEVKYEEYSKILMDGEPVPLKEYMRTQIGYQNKDMLYLIGELPAEHRPTFKKMFDTMIDRMIEMQVKSLPLS